MRAHFGYGPAAMLSTAVALLAACATPVDPVELAAENAELHALQAANAAFTVLDYKTAFAGYLPWAQKGDHWTETRVAYMYHLGLGVQQDEGEAQRWYQKAATEGYGPAAIALGYDYMAPLSGVPDYGQALKWFTYAADHGDIGADLYLSILYEHGLGVPQDHDQAVHWLNQFVARQKVSGPWQYKFPKFSSGDNSGGFGVALNFVVQEAAAQQGVPRCNCRMTGLTFHYVDGRATNVNVTAPSGDLATDAAAVDFLQKTLLPPVLASLSQQEAFTVYITG